MGMYWVLVFSVVLGVHSGFEVVLLVEEELVALLY